MTIQTDRRAELSRVLTRLWEALDGTRQIITGYDEAGVPYTATEHAAPLASAIVKVLAEIAALPVESAEVSPVDEIRARREARRANDPAAPAGGGKSRRRAGGNRTS